MPPRPLPPGRQAAETRLRITMMPPARPRPLPRRQDSLPLWLAGLAASLLVVGTVGWGATAGLARQAASDYHDWAARSALKNGEPTTVAQREWRAAIAANPGANAARLELARSYIDAQWYGGAIEQAAAVLAHRRTRAQSSMAYTYLGYCHLWLGEREAGLLELHMAAAIDPENAIAQSVLERLGRQRAVPPLP